MQVTGVGVSLHRCGKIHPGEKNPVFHCESYKGSDVYHVNRGIPSKLPINKHGAQRKTGLKDGTYTLYLNLVF